MRHRMQSVVVFLFVLGAVVLADPATVAIQQRATLDTFQGFPSGVIVTVAVNCGDPAPTEFELNVGVRQGDITSESGGVFFPATGGRQVVTIEVFGPFAVGDASASATLACFDLLEGFDLGRTIRISQ
jgi:hypothetical protein